MQRTADAGGVATNQVRGFAEAHHAALHGGHHRTITQAFRSRSLAALTRNAPKQRAGLEPGHREPGVKTGRGAAGQRLILGLILVLVFADAHQRTPGTVGPVHPLQVGDFNRRQPGAPQATFKADQGD